MGQGSFRLGRIALVLVALLLLPAGPAQAQERKRLDVRLFARVPSPGAPQGVAVGPNGRIYTATLNAEGNGDPNAPSKVFAYSPSGKLLRSYEISGQDLSRSHGLTGLAFDAAGRLYVGDLAPPRVLRLNVRTGAQELYASVRDVPPCTNGASGECSPGTRDHPAWPDYLAFTANGALYVTDSLQGLLWRIPKGGGRGQVWFSDPGLATEIGPPAFGPSALKLMPDGRTLMFTTVAQQVGTTPNLAAGRIYTIPIGPGDRPGRLSSFWESDPVDAPGGIDFGRSGRAYVALSGTNQIAVFDRNGELIERGPSPTENAMLDPPIDTPLGLAFEGQRLIVANNSFTAHDPNAWALLDVYAGERGVPVVLPRIGDRCTPATGRLVGRRLGPARLGRRRASIRRAFDRRSSPSPSIDRFCLQDGATIRVGYPSRYLLRRLSIGQRRRVRDRAILILTSSRRYAVRGVRAGSSARAVRRRFRRVRRIRAGASIWYFARGRRSRLVFEVRRGRVRVIGIADRPLTASRRGAKRLIRSFR